MGGWVDYGWRDGWMEGWMDYEWVDGYMASLTEVVDDYLKRLKQCERSGVWMQMKTKGR